jgi:hypothetical protein
VSFRDCLEQCVANLASFADGLGLRRGKSGFQRQFALLVDQFLDSSGSTRQFPDFFIPILGAGDSCGDSGCLCCCR